MVCVVCLVMFRMNVKSEAVLTEMQNTYPSVRSHHVFVFLIVIYAFFGYGISKTVQRFLRKLTVRANPAYLE